MDLSKKKQILEEKKQSLQRAFQRGLRVGLMLGASLLSKDSHAATNIEPYQEGLPKNEITTNTRTDSTQIFETDSYIQKMRDHGRFFVSKSDNSVIYLTDEQVDSLKLTPVSSIAGVIRARETGTPETADEQDLQRAYGTTSSQGYMGLYQYGLPSFQNLFLYGLAQNKSAEIRALCQKVLKSGVSVNDPALKEFAKAYADALQAIENGENSKKALGNVFGIASSIHKKGISKLQISNKSLASVWTKKLNQADPKTFRQLQDNFFTDVYLPLLNSKEARSSVPLEYYAVYGCSEIHRHLASTATDLQTGDKAKAQAILNREAGRSSHKPKMQQAHDNIVKVINGSSYFDYDYVKDCHRAGANVDMTKIDENVRDCAYSHWCLNQQKNETLQPSFILASADQTR
jgi:hypothetical protein